jgi:hypothetical protein
MTDTELRDELFTMLGAGHETTATGLAFAFELLLRNPRVLARLREELDGGDGDAYLDAVVKETLRLRPVIDAAERTLTVPRTVAGWELPGRHQGVPRNRARAPARGPVSARARVPPGALPRRTAPSPTAWLPFGGGIRRCIGAALAHAEMAEVLRVAIAAVEAASAARAARPDRPARDHARAEARRGGDRRARQPPLPGAPAGAGSGGRIIERTPGRGLRSVRRRRALECSRHPRAGTQGDQPCRDLRPVRWPGMLRSAVLARRRRGTRACRAAGTRPAG